MKKKTRTILFSIFVFLFFLISPSIILLSEGYRLDFENKRIIKTGGLFLKTLPKKAEIYLDGKFKKETSLIFGTALIKNLLPKKHKVEIKKEGYFPWQKSLEIEEGQVTQVKDLILFPKNLKLEFLLSGIKDFWPLTENKVIIHEEGKEGWFLSVYDLKKKLKNHLISENEISKKGAVLKKLEISENPKEIDLQVEIEGKLKKFSLSIDEFPPILKEKIENLPQDVVAFQKFENFIYYLDKSGFLIKTDPEFRGKLRLSWNQFQVKDNFEYKLMVFGSWLFLKEDGRIYFFNRENNSFEKIFDSVSDLKISPDGKKMAIFSKSEIWILFLTEKEDQPRKKAGEKIFLTRFSKEIENLFWLNSSYLIFNSGNEIKISEIDDRDKINIYDLLEIEKPKFSFFEKRIFILSEGNLYFSEKLIP